MIPNTAIEDAELSRTVRSAFKRLHANDSSDDVSGIITDEESVASSGNSTLALVSDREIGGARLLNLLPGSYELQIMAVSLAGNSSWTPSLMFDVAASPMGKFPHFLFKLLLTQ